MPESWYVFNKSFFYEAIPQQRVFVTHLLLGEMVFLKLAGVKKQMMTFIGNEFSELGFLGLYLFLLLVLLVGKRPKG